MATGYHDFVAGETLTAVNLEDFCMRQSVMIFASAAARNSALAAVLQEGMVAYLLDLNMLCVYSGAAWSTIGPVHGAGFAWTPSWTQSATITKTVQQAAFSRVGRQVTANFSMTATSAGTAANPILLGVPVSAAASVQAVGTVIIFDASISQFITYSAYMQGASAFGLLQSGSTGVAATPTIASGDLAFAQLSYEAAADG